MKPTLLILAAGMASRYGSMKQVDGFGPNGETIIDYSIYDAIQAGFGKVVFIIREEFADKFKEIFEPKLKGRVEVDYAFQSYDLSKFGITKEIERAKPWGTGHAVLSASGQVNEPFAVINADDFYGRDAFEKMYQFLTTDVSNTQYALMGYEVDKTLSDFGAVSRGICKVDGNGNLKQIDERTKVYKKDGVIVHEDDNGTATPLDDDDRASMNFWGFSPAIFPQTEQLFIDFVNKNEVNPKAEFFIPLMADGLINSGEAAFKVIPTSSKWFGVTYKEDKPVVMDSLKALVDNGTYPETLYP
ncbi:MAG: nucleotidyltransferase [Mucilaginibacter polytrichastri]|nr:nucleotidyltransferase [Mucilaginibacter polytrichastri]